MKKESKKMKKQLARLVSMFVVVGMLLSMATFTASASSAEPLLKDDFEYADTAAAISAGWVNTNNAETLGTTEFVKVSESDSHGKSMKITKNSDNSGTKIAIDGAGTTGKYQIKLSAYVGAELVTRIKYGDNKSYALNLSSSGKKVYGLDGNYANALWQSNVWMDISILFDLDAGKAYIDIVNSDTKQVILSAKEYTIDKNIQINGLEFITWNAALSYVDDVSVAPYVVDLNVLSDDFEYADTAAAISAGWVNTNNATSLGTTEFVKVSENDSHGKSMKITKNFDNSGTKTAISGMETTGKYKIRMSVNIGQELVARTKFGANGMYVLNFSNNGSFYVQDKNGQVNTERAFLKDDWNDIEMLFDLNKGVWNIKITNVNGEFFNKDYEIDKNIQINGLEFITWQAGYSYIDDVSVERYFAVPSPSVTMTDITGAKVDYSKTVTPGVKTIAIDFGESMNAGTVDGMITLDGVVVNGTFDSANQVYTITRTESLAEGEHTLYISEDVQNTNGDKMALAYELNFVSGDENCKVTIAGLYDVPMGQSLAFHKKPIKHAINGVEAAGSYTLKYSYKNGNDFNMLVTAGDKEESVINIGANNATFVDGTWQGADKNTVRNTWYDVEVVFTYDGTDLTYTATIKDQNGKAIIENVAGNIAGNGAVNSIKFTSWNNQAVMNYLDNVWFGPTGGAALLEDNFNGYTDESQLSAAGWEKIDAAGEWKFETLFDENSKIKAFSAITPGSNLLIKADYVNPGSAKSAVLIAAYYNDDKLVGVETISVESGIEDFSAGEIFRNTSVPNTAFDEMAIYCWDSILNMYPYAKALPFVGE